MNAGIVVLLASLLFQVVSAVSMSACGEISRPGYYELTSDLITSRDMMLKYNIASCIQINSPNVHLNCKNHTIKLVRDNDSETVLSRLPTGIFVANSKNVTITNCRIVGFDRGIYLEFSGYSTLRNNEMTGNRFGFGVFGTEEWHYINDVDESNRVEGVPVFYKIRAQDSVYESPYTNTFYCISCRNVTLKKLEAKNNWFGVLFYNTQYSRIDSVSASYNGYAGIILQNSENNIIEDVTAKNNLQYGIDLWRSSKNVLSNSTASFNEYGIYLEASKDNILKNNRMDYNHYNFGVWDPNSSTGFMNSIDRSNLAGGKSVLYLVRVRDLVVDGSNASTLYCTACNNVTVENISARNMMFGVIFVDSENCKAVNITAENCGYGAYSRSSKNITFAKVSLKACNAGVGLSGSEKNIIKDVTVENCKEGINLIQSKGNGLENITVDSARFGIQLINSDRNNLNNIEAKYCGYGLYIWKSNGNKADKGEIIGSRICGVKIYRAEGNTVTNFNLSNEKNICQDNPGLFSGFYTSIQNFFTRILSLFKLQK
jgi:parallel beta-helix repeat protein